MVRYSLGSMISGLNGPISQLPLAQATLSPPLWRNMSTSSSQAVLWFHLAIVLGYQTFFFGLLDDAKQELKTLQHENPESKIVLRFLQQLETRGLVNQR